MSQALDPLIPDIRAASRELVRQFGFLNRTVADTDMAPSAVHAVIEIGRAPGLSAKQLGERLMLEKSTISRLVRTLVERGEIREERSSSDGRSKHLHLTGQGIRSLTAIDGFADAQVRGALAAIDAAQRQNVCEGLQVYAGALKRARGAGAGARATQRAAIKTGYVPGLGGRIVDMLVPYMHRFAGFGAAFESRVAGDIAEFLSRLDDEANGIWRAELGGRIVGSISIDGQDLGGGLAHLRWFIVEDGVRGGGIGEALLSRAVAFCDQRGYREIHLWTVKGLDAARALYDRHGFTLAAEYSGDQWGAEVIEHKLVRVRP